MKTVAFHTLGCKVNSYESEAMLKHFVDASYSEVDFKETADVYVINTCTVTNSGDSKSRQMIRKAIRNNQDAIVCVVGCYSQVASEQISKIEGVSVIIGTQFRNDIVALVDEYILTKKQVVRVGSVRNVEKFEDLTINRFSNTRAYIKIQDGCNNFCTYCIIPYARGNVRSRKPESVLEQVRGFVANGYKEVVLTGIHTAGYGEDFNTYCFYDLLKDLIEVEGLMRLRISSIEISQVTLEIIELLKHSKVIVDHLHVPIQAGSDAVLKRMNRKYTTQQYIEKIELIRSFIPTISFTTDVIVGFPGETVEDFENCVRVIQEVGFMSLHVFPYSPRNNTPAAAFKDQVDGIEKSRRVQVLMDLSKSLLKDYSMRLLDCKVDVLFEKVVDGYLIGHASNFVVVKVKGSKDLVGTIQCVKLVQYKDELIGEII